MSLSDDQTIISNKQFNETKPVNNDFEDAPTIINSKNTDKDNSISFIGYTLENRYQINEEIGKGGFGKVYLALDSKLKRIVAVKFLSPVVSSSTNFEEIFARFEQEAITIAGFSHQNIVHVYDFDKDSIHGAYIVMEYVDGNSLREKIKSSGKVDANLTLKIITEVAHGLNYAHKKGIIHRDIKPGNILLTKNDVAKIVDFGLAHTETAFEYSVSGVAMGTFNYMPPEQQKDAKNVDKTADIYALGKVLYEMLTGKSPVSIIPKYIPKGFDNIIYKCIEPEPENRYLSADDLIVDLNSVQLTNKTVEISSSNVFADNMLVIGKCAACGHINNENAKHCVSCGADLFTPCPECKNEIQKNTKFCPSCGANVFKYFKFIDLFQKLQSLYQNKKNEEILKFKKQANDFKTAGKNGKKLKNELLKIILTAENNIKTAKNICYTEIPSAVKNINLAKLQSLINHYNTIVIPDKETLKLFQDAKNEILIIVEQYVELLKKCNSDFNNGNFDAVLAKADKINLFKPQGNEERKIKKALVAIFNEAKQAKINNKEIKDNRFADDLFQKLQILYQEKKYNEILQFKEQIYNLKVHGKSSEKTKKVSIKLIETVEKNIQTAKNICEIDIPNAVKNINLAELQRLIGQYHSIAVSDEETEKLFQKAKDDIAKTVELYVALLKEANSELEKQNYNSVISFADKINMFLPQGDEEKMIKKALVKIVDQAKLKNIRINKIENDFIAEAIKNNDVDYLLSLKNDYESIAIIDENKNRLFDESLNQIIKNLIVQRVDSKNVDSIKTLETAFNERSIVTPEINRLLIDAEKQIYLDVSNDYINKINSLLETKNFLAINRLLKSKVFLSFYKFAIKNYNSFEKFIELTKTTKKMVKEHYKRLETKFILIFITVTLIVVLILLFWGYIYLKTDTIAHEMMDFVIRSFVA